MGSPGTGKTESVKQVARLIGKELLVVDFSHLVDSKLGQTVKNLATLLMKSIIFLSSKIISSYLMKLIP